MEERIHKHHTGLVVMVALVAIIAIMLIYFTNSNQQQAQKDLTGQAYSKTVSQKQTASSFQDAVYSCLDNNKGNTAGLQECLESMMEEPDYTGINPENVLPGWLMSFICENGPGDMFWECYCPGGNLGGTEDC